MVIDMFAKIGWAYDLKQPSVELVNNTLWKQGINSLVWSNEKIRKKGFVFLF
jgi:hypothetical protein